MGNPEANKLKYNYRQELCLGIKWYFDELFDGYLVDKVFGVLRF